MKKANSKDKSNKSNHKKELKAVYEYAVQERDRAKQEIENIVKRVDPVELLSHISLVTQFVPEGHRDSIQFLQRLREKPALHFITGLCLKNSILTDTRPTNQEVGQVMELLDKYFIHHSQDLIFQSVKNEEVPEVDGVILLARLQKMVSAINRGMYEYQLHDLLHNTFGKLDEYFSKTIGVTVADAIVFGQKIADRYIRLVNERVQTAKEAQENARKELNDPVKGIEIKKILKEKKSTQKEMLQSYFGYLLFTYIQVLFVFSIEDFCKEENVDVTKFTKYISAFSCKFGKVNQDYNSPLDDNIIFVKPIINIDEHRYFTPLIKDAMAFNLPIIFERFLAKERLGQTKIWHNYRDKKSRYVENKTYEYLTRLFPKENIFRNLHYSYSGQDYEIDCIIIYDNKIFLVECKGGAFSEGAQRGGVLSLKKDLRELVENAFEQGRRARDYIKSTQNVIFTDGKGKNPLIIEYKPNQMDFFIINVTLENLMSLASVPKNLQSLGLFQDNEYPWSVNLFELDHVTKHIPTPTIFIHYLERRLVAQKENIYHTFDELSFLGWYLQKGNFYPLKTEENTPYSIIMLDGTWVADFDNHYLYGKKAPELDIEPDWKEIINIIEELKPMGYSNVSSTLLDFDHKAREYILKNVKGLIEKSQKDGKSHDFTVLYREPLDTGFTFMTQCNRKDLKEKLYTYCAIKKYRTKTKRWIGMGRDVVDDEYFVNDIIWLDSPWVYDNTMEELARKFPFIKGDEGLS